MQKIRNIRGFVSAYLKSNAGKAALSKTPTRNSLNSNMSHAFEKALNA